MTTSKSLAGTVSGHGRRYNGKGNPRRCHRATTKAFVKQDSDAMQVEHHIRKDEPQ